MADLSPTLPQELERDIFLLTAYTDPPSVPTLMLVAHRVKAWVEILRFRVIMLFGETGPTEPNFPFADDTEFSHLLSIPPATLRNSVRNLCLHNVSKQTTEYILSTCDQLQDLHIYPADYNTSLLDIVANLPLQRLHCNLQVLFSSELWSPQPVHINFTHSLFSNITHLECFDDTNRPPPSSYWAGLASIPHLTHLSFSDYNFLPLVPQALRDCASLRVLLFQFNMYDWDELAGLVIPTKDPRFVQMLYPTHIEEYTGDWLQSALTGRDFWFRAEEHIKKHLAGEVTTYVMDESVQFPVVEQ